MDFVTITDHDTIAGCLEIADRARRLHLGGAHGLVPRGAAGGPRALPRDHARGPRLPPGAQPRPRGVRRLPARQRDRLLAGAPLLRGRGAARPRRTAGGWRELFPVWETRNGSRARELNMPAAIYIETHGGTGTGGSDDHAGVDIGRTWTETPPAATPEEFLRHVREGRAEARGDAGQRREVGARGDGARHARPDLADDAPDRLASRPDAARARTCAEPTRRRAEDGRARDERGATRAAARPRRPRPRRTRARCWAPTLDRVGLEPERPG